MAASAQHFLQAPRGSTHYEVTKALQYQFRSAIALSAQFTDHAQAALWFRKAAEQGDAKAQKSLGNMYGTGQGVPQNYAQAALWYRKASEQGDAQSQFSLGYLYEQGQGVAQDYTQAVLWFRKAAEQGDARAQGALCIAYTTGHGVPKSNTEAYFWSNVAAAGDLDESMRKMVAEERDRLASLLPPEILSRVQVRAGKWFEEHPAKPQ
jgi:TPR repeat protein